MRSLEKALKATESRKTRFHTDRGTLMEARGWLDLPRAITARVRGRTPAEPWMVHGAVCCLEQSIRPDWQVLELGSGVSTAWYARHAQHVLSFEDDALWEASVRELLTERALGNWQLELVSLDQLLARVSVLPDDGFDLVVIDANEQPLVTRVDQARVSMSKVKPGGLLVFDDFDSQKYRSAEKMLQPWSARYFTGIKSFPMMAVETAIFQRPLSS